MNLVRRLQAAWRILTYSPANRYEAATFSPYRSILPGATAQSMRLDASAATRLQLLQRARWWERNSSLLQKIADIWELYTVGAGLLFTPTSSEEDWNQAASEWYNAWIPFADLASRQSFLTLQQVLARAVLVDGEAFIILTRGDTGFPRIQCFESHECATPNALKDQEGKTIFDGVVVDGRSRPIGYYFVQRSDGRETYRFVDAESVVHIFEPSRIGQLRGITMLHSGLNDLHEQEDLLLAELRAARDATRITNVITQGNPQSEIADMIAAGGAAPGVDADGKRTRYSEGVPGTTLLLDPGDIATQFKIERPSESMRYLFESLEHRLCSSVGIPLQMIRPASLQGTVERALLQQVSAWFLVRSGVFAELFARVYLYVIKDGMVRGNLEGAPFDWFKYSWRPPKAVDVDPGRSNAALISSLAAGLTTYEAAYASMGQDWKEQLRQKAREVRYIKDLAKEYDIEAQNIAASALPAPAVDVTADQAAQDAADEIIPVP